MALAAASLKDSEQRADSAFPLATTFFPALANVSSNCRRFQRVQDQVGRDCRHLLSVKTEWNQALFYHLYSIDRQGDRELLRLRIAFLRHGRNNGIPLSYLHHPKASRLLLKRSRQK